MHYCAQFGGVPIFVKATKNVHIPITVRVALQGLEPEMVPGNNQIGVGLVDFNLQGPMAEESFDGEVVSRFSLTVFIALQIQFEHNPFRY